MGFLIPKRVFLRGNGNCSYFPSTLFVSCSVRLLSLLLFVLLHGGAKGDI